jgi:hypothetical protein
MAQALRALGPDQGSGGLRQIPKTEALYETTQDLEDARKAILSQRSLTWLADERPSARLAIARSIAMP